MGSLLHPRLVDWFDAGMARGQFDLPSGRHIILNQFPRLMKVSRLRASAGVDSDSLCQFFRVMNPNVVTVSDGSPLGLRHQLQCECDRLPALRKVFVPVLPYQRDEYWFIYTPPLAVMRQGWRDFTTERALATRSAAGELESKRTIKGSPQLAK